MDGGLLILIAFVAVLAFDLRHLVVSIHGPTVGAFQRE